MSALTRKPVTSLFFLYVILKNATTKGKCKYQKGMRQDVLKKNTIFEQVRSLYHIATKIGVWHLLVRN